MSSSQQNGDVLSDKRLQMWSVMIFKRFSKNVPSQTKMLNKKRHHHAPSLNFESYPSQEDKTEKGTPTPSGFSKTAVVDQQAWLCAARLAPSFSWITTSIVELREDKETAEYGSHRRCLCALMCVYVLSIGCYVLCWNLL